jgi:hypothetical protein
MIPRMTISAMTRQAETAAPAAALILGSLLLLTRP